LDRANTHPTCLIPASNHILSCATVSTSFKYIPMENKPSSEKYVYLNPRIASIELTLPPHLEKYSEELRDRIHEKFSFEMMNPDLEDKIQKFIENFLKSKGEF